MSMSLYEAGKLRNPSASPNTKNLPALIMKNTIKFIPIYEPHNEPENSGDFPKYNLTQGGIKLGCLWRLGRVTDNQNRTVAFQPIAGLSKLFCLQEEDAREVFYRELDRLNPNWRPLP